MTNVSKIREAHRIITNAGSVMTRDQIELLRSVLPPLPKQKALAELTHDVYDAWIGADGNDWDDEAFGELETWLDELHTQLKGVEVATTISPALPAGMRLAKHEKYGYCVAAPNVDSDGDRIIFALDDNKDSGTSYRWVPADSLTFIDDEPAAPAHPEFLETEADYENAPEGTIVVSAKAAPAMKCGHWWESAPYMDRASKTMASESRRVLRWGWGE